MSETPLRTADVAELLSQPEPPPTRPTGVTLSALLADVLDTADRGAPVVRTLACGLELVDDAGGLPRGEITVLAGSPGVGKSLLADALILGALRAAPDARADIHALETTPPVRAARLLCGAAVAASAAGDVTGVPVAGLLRGTLRPEGVARLRSTAAALARDIGERLVFRDSARTCAELATAIRCERPDVVLLDHLGLVENPGESGVDAADASLGALLAAVREADAAGLIVAEINKVALRSAAVGLEGVRGTARLASLAAAVLVLDRAEDADQEARDPMLRLSLLKCRHGRAGVYQQLQLFGGLAHIHPLPGVERILPKPRTKKGGFGD